MLQLMNQLGMMLRQHTYEIAMMVMATLLVIYGDEVNGLVKRLVGKYPFIVRALVFVALCAFGYGYLLIGFTPILASWIYAIPLHLLGPAVLITLLVLGILAERKKQL
ncbi:uncharacterized protein DUF3392 [Idiomarina fontislapidosi]|uniref:DUF3392 domain-containing protein n=1 Tax=Idiomarina fontislapidosi TaxID=263723 RepID=A0A432Y999_9GAMM|nr:DUF3392 domain-containing protein [Idiomarina fontislapidosi]PYE34515.1 uncharacterized protein DUF3392 [Idiomarina fontislapidosi]RUO57527.1 DUF3392 domain-containing protein [Idiomarina fontislapidosi]